MIGRAIRGHGDDGKAGNRAARIRQHGPAAERTALSQHKGHLAHVVGHEVRKQVRIALGFDQEAPGAEWQVRNFEGAVAASAGAQVHRIA